ncbi:hypothetical protein, conserved [Trypanosoma brucei gambiense DAL972]|uniref:Uncharacterized protein n=2 Tax=Trypanosoma brucei TaxID=5691 RepID=D0A991_TRYB9|nr:hypothetical protein, conserved [Trypanosoma brucei gambiense DAL972]RHW67749.1 hypothetical protein DPX39_110099200 [Trypanosoma brucei equiperdum]CBH18242.1 hypothetical protein, conserved [Trypanosoma brucei gambiense DAL972]|eukprot:XP_011780506.1 hypothetical protein, conserved [Trypanosoma brucei gambiense DAL972]
MSVASEANDVVSFLSKVGERYKQHRELLRRKFLEDERRDCPFKPTLSKYTSHRKPSKGSECVEAVEKRLYQLHVRQQELAEERQAAHNKRESAELKAAMRPPRLTAQARSLSPRDPAEVSRQWLQKREEKLIRLREAIIKGDLDAMQSKPTISSYAEANITAERRNGKSIEDYLLAEHEARRERMHHHYEGGTTASGRSSSPLRRVDSQPVFRPRISNYARRLSLPGRVVDRLLSKKSRKGDALRDENCTFAPRVSSTSTRLLRYFYKNPNVSVYDRLCDESYMRPNGCYAKKGSSHVEPGSFGVPHINETSRAIVERKRTGDDAPLRTYQLRSPTERLHACRDPTASSGRHRRHCQHMISEQLEKEISQCTFRPRVDEESNQMWRRRLQQLKGGGHPRNVSGLRELLWRRSETRMKEELRRQRELQEQKEVEECTFHPKVGRAPRRRVECALSVPERNEAWQQRRQKKLNCTREEVERSETSECSFHPSVSSLHSAASVPASNIAGYDSHLRRHAESRRIIREMQEWWRPKSHISRNSGSARRVRSQPQRREKEWWDLPQKCELSSFTRTCSPTSWDDQLSSSQLGS